MATSVLRRRGAQEFLSHSGTMDYPLATARILRNTAWNIASSVLPLVAGIFAVPILITQLGTARFGVLSLSWTAIGYLGFLDLGLGRAITKFSSEKLALGRAEDIPSIFWDAVWVLVFLSMAGGTAVAVLAHTITASVLHVSGRFEAETTTAIRLTGLAIPLVTVGAAFRAVLEARQLFAGVSVAKTSAGLLGFLAPLIVLSFAPRLDVAVGTLCAIRLLMAIAFAMLASRHYPGLSVMRGLHPHGILRLLRYGGWVTVSSVISPLMVSMDRFMIGGLTSVNAITYYVTPQEIGARLLAIPVGLQSALFPVFSGLSAACRENRQAIYEHAMNIIVAVMLPASVTIILLAPEALTFWLGAAFSSHSYRAAQIIALSLFFNSLAHIPAVLLESSGRPDICAKFHMAEFPLYAGLCALFIRLYGIEGAATAGLLRVVIDAGLLIYAVRSWVPLWPWTRRDSLIAAVALAGAAVVAVTHTSLLLRFSYIGTVGWFSVRWAASTIRKSHWQADSAIGEPRLNILS
jgi:O-antigen/teichoic acid export membrane protein